MERIYSQPLENTLKEMHASLEGISSQEANVRLKRFGKNILEERAKNKWLIFFLQFHNFLIYVLLLASMISIFAGKIVDFFVIAIIVFINALIGFLQQIKAESAIKALRKMTETKAKVMRNQKIMEIYSSHLVPGDIILLSEGDIVSADIRLIETSGLMVDEASITGESVAVAKDHAAQIKEDALPFETRNALFCGTTVVKGYGKGVVVKTGKNTYFAKIARETLEESPKTPLVRALDFFSRRYLVVLVILFACLGVIGYLQNRSFLELAYIFIAQMVSAIPEGLPIVVTLVMIVGAIKLSRQNTLVRHLPSVETLGSATVIASDKTGTITRGNLIVKEYFSTDLEKLKLIAALCNDVDINKKDPIDRALSEWIDNFHEIRSQSPRVLTYPFDVHYRKMYTVNLHENRKMLFCKGAYEALKESATNEDLSLFDEIVEKFSNEGLRSLAFGCSGRYEEGNYQVQIVGIVGFLDPPKDSVKDAVRQAKKASIKVMMLTGDHALTAKAIAKEVDIYQENDLILTGSDIEKLDDGALYEKLKKATVLARILPEHKLRVVKVMQANGEIVAVSGDGVNDAPALKVADLGIAMGSGTEAAKDVSKMIITDSNLSVIVKAIRNGRNISANIRKVIYYLISTSFLEIFLQTMAIFANLPLPLTAIQILWINLVTDGVQDKTFPFAKEESNLMNQRPIKPIKQFFDQAQIINILIFGLFSGMVCFGIFTFLLHKLSYLETITVTFTCVVFAQWANGIQAQKEKEPFFKNVKRSFSINPFIYLGVGIGLILQLFAIHVLDEWFHLSKMTLSLWKYPLISFFASFFIVEIRKWFLLIFEKKA